MDLARSPRQREILEKSLGIIAQEGVQNFTMRHIGAAMNMSEAAIYRHFPNKVAILSALLDDLLCNMQSLLQTHVKARQTQGVQAFFSAWLRQLSARPEMTAIIFAEEIFQSEVLLAHKIKDCMDCVEAGLLAALRSKYKVWVVLGSVRFLVTRWRQARFVLNLEVEGKALLKSLFRSDLLDNQTVVKPKEKRC